MISKSADASAPDDEHAEALTPYLVMIEYETGDGKQKTGVIECATYRQAIRSYAVYAATGRPVRVVRYIREGTGAPNRTLDFTTLIRARCYSGRKL